MKSLGRHLIMELYDCDRQVLNDIDRIDQIVLEAARTARATVVSQVGHQFSPHGVSAIVAIGESHLAVHTWPEHGYCAADIFTCGDQADNDGDIQVLRQAFRAGDCAALEVFRGLRDHTGESVPVGRPYQSPSSAAT